MDIWNRITTTFKVRDIIKNWTLNHGCFGDDIVIKQIKQNSISIDAPNSRKNITTHVNVSKAEFVDLYNDWLPYIKGSIPRNQLRDKNRSTRYIIDIFKELQVRNLIP